MVAAQDTLTVTNSQALFFRRVPLAGNPVLAPAILRVLHRPRLEYFPPALAQRLDACGAYLD